MPLRPSFRHPQSTEVRKQTSRVFWHGPRANSAYVILTSSHINQRGRLRTGQYNTLRLGTHIYPPKHIHVIFIRVSRYSCCIVVHLLMCLLVDDTLPQVRPYRKTCHTYRVRYSRGHAASTEGLRTHTHRYGATTLHFIADSF